MTGEALGYFMDLALEKGALDVFYTPVFMKKNRPAYMITILCSTQSLNEFAELLFKETTTIGVRINEMKRLTLDREVATVNTQYGEVRVKIVTFPDGSQRFKYEYEDLKEICKKTGLSFLELGQKIKKQTKQ